MLLLLNSVSAVHFQNGCGPRPCNDNNLSFEDWEGHLYSDVYR